MTTPNGRTFTQAQLNSYLAQERRRIAAKYEGHDDFKAKAEQFDALLAIVPAVDEPDAGDSQYGPGASQAAAAETDAQHEAPPSTTQDDPAQDAVTHHNEPSQNDTVRGLQTQLLRQQISAQQHLDPDLWDRVRGETADEIAADVQTLVGKFGAGAGGRPPRNLRSGASVADVRSPKEKAVAALRGMNRGA